MNRRHFINSAAIAAAAAVLPVASDRPAVRVRRVFRGHAPDAARYGDVLHDVDTSTLYIHDGRAWVELIPVGH